MPLPKKFEKCSKFRFQPVMTVTSQKKHRSAFTSMLEITDEYFLL